MIKEAFGTGATTEAAIEAAKAELGAPWDADVNIEVVEAAKKKTFGLFGGSLAKVRAYYEVPDEVKTEKKVSKKVESPKRTVNKQADSKPAPVAEKTVEKAKTVESANIPTFSGDISKMAEAYIRSILEGMGVSEIGITATEDDEGVYVQLDCGKDFGYIIGRRGETLDAIQYLTRLVINKGKDTYKRVSINAGNYREKREETLRELAKKNAVKVKKYGRNVCLDPMNPYERRIIHTTIQEIEGVDSHSVGSESDRRVIITLAEGFKATNSNYSRGGQRRGGDYRRKDNGNFRQNNSQSEEQPTREPRSDFSTVNLYGKIEPKNSDK